MNAGESSADEYNGVDLEPILRIHSNLLLLFHAHWLRNKFTVMRESITFLSRLLLVLTDDRDCE